MYNDDMERLLLNSDPARTPLDAPLSWRALDDLDRITEGRVSGDERVPAPPRRHRARWIALSSIAFLILVSLVAVQTFAPRGGSGGSVEAASPRPLRPTGTPVPFGEAMQNAVAQLERADTSTAEPKRASHFEAWYADTDVDGSGNATSLVSPREQRVRWNADLSGSLLVTAGVAYHPDRPNAIAAATPIAPGTVIRDEKFSAGRMGILYDELPPTDAAAMRDYLVLHSGLADSTDPVHMLDAVAELLGEWTLPPKQESAILLMLASMSGIESLGYVDDRLGRAGLAFRATSPAPDAAFESVLVVSADSGRILSLETVYLGGLDDLDAAPGSVVRYVAWK